MKKIIAMFILTLIFISLIAQADSFEAIKADIDAFVDTVIKTHNVPGVSIAIVKGDSVIYEKGYGYRDLKGKLPVTEKTIFCIGSSTKAFTATALSIEAERGGIDFSEKVVKYLPDFELSDKSVSDNATVLDLLTHRIGLPRHDLMWYGSDFTRDEIYKRIKYLKLSRGLREAFQYQNHMFMTAGVLLERVSGKTWENYVMEEIFSPLMMNETNLSTNDSKKSSDYSLPYTYDGKKFVELNFREFPAMGPAGTINSNASDMAKWLRFNLCKGKANGKELVSQSSFEMMTSPQMIASSAAGSKERSYVSYGMGWFVEYYRGHYMVHHGGNIDGFSALVSFFPDDSFGVVVLTNMNATPVPSIINYYISDRLLNLEPVNWSGRIAESNEEGENLTVKEDKQRVKNTKPSHSLKDYAGTYENEGYGKLKVTFKNNKLHLNYNVLDVDLAHFHYDVFTGSSEILGDMKMKFRFETSSDGRVSKVYAPLEMSVDEICFERVAESEFTSESYLKKFQGVYSTKDFSLSVDLISGKLKLTIAGQPQYTLLAKGKNAFSIEGLTGFEVSFEEKGGFVTAINLIQPNGTFRVEKNK
ncbi:MAG: serine hydrolase [bacterium]|nr:serine hydrolase [bacterium]